MGRISAQPLHKLDRDSIDGATRCLGILSLASDDFTFNSLRTYSELLRAAKISILGDLQLLRLRVGQT